MNILDLSGSTRALVAAAIALVPAIVAYVRGRQVARFADDPALPERLFAGSRAASTSIVLTIAALIVLTGRAGSRPLSQACTPFFVNWNGLLAIVSGANKRAGSQRCVSPCPRQFFKRPPAS